MRTLFLLAVAATALVDAAPTWATPVALRYTNGSLKADITLDVEAGQAVGGSGTISGGGLIGELPMSYLQLGVAAAPLVISPATGCVPGATGCYDVGRFSCDCSFVNEDTAFDVGAAIPINASGIAFQVGGPVLNYGFALYDAGDGTVGEILVGDRFPQPLILNGGTAGGTLEFTVIPEPASFYLLSIGVFGLRLIARRAASRAAGAKP